MSARNQSIGEKLARERKNVSANLSLASFVIFSRAARYNETVSIYMVGGTQYLYLITDSIPTVNQ